MAEFLAFGGLSPSSLGAAKACLNSYRHFCATEDIHPFPLVADVVAVWILKSDHQPKYAANNLGILERVRLRLLPLWLNSPGVAKAQETLLQDSVANLLRLSTPRKALPRGGLTTGLGHCTQDC